MSRISALFVAACLCALVVIDGAQAAVHHRARVKHPRVHGLAAPSLLTPANGAAVEQVPTLTWGGVKGAAEYEYQVSADSRFNSIVLGSGAGRGTSTTHNLAAALGQTVTDGTYYWRVRGLTATKEPGAWSATRTLRKTWAQAPQLLGPANGAAINWPTNPLVLSWSTVADATEYVVTVATDPGLSNIVLGTATSPQTTHASVFALPGTLATGQYYWAITPVDNEGHRGTRSRVASFNWSWPTSTSTQVGDLNPNPQVFDPQFSWAPVAGAAHYEVEVNSAVEFPAGSKWCCGERTIGTSLSPLQTLGNNQYYWRMRAIDAGGNAGVWNYGESFTKLFDSVTPTIPSLALSDVHGNPLPSDASTNTPIVTWAPVPGAASYEVQVTPYVSGSGCNWLAEEPQERKTYETSSLSWTPLGPDRNSIGPSAWPKPRTDTWQMKEAGTEWCLRVAARSDDDAMRNQVVSEWTQLGGEEQAAFKFESQPEIPGPSAPETPASAYVLPGAGSTSPRTPLFTWERVPGASMYYVVIARDSGFTNVVDVANTVVPAYAPPLGGEQPLDDETTTYYWAVVPVNTKGEAFKFPPNRDSPQSFNKSSVPPAPLGPVNGVDVASQPAFRWTPVEGVLNYTLEVSQDPTFGSPIDNVRTDSTSYTSSSTYPSNVTLYWRVRANDTNPRNEGLHWSAVQTFRRTLPVPSPAAANPTGGQAIPVLSWTPVTGAIAYDLHVEQADGTTKDFTVDSTSFTPTEWYGTGVWRWQVRAEFPSGLYQTVPGGYFSPTQPFVHTLAAPTGAAGVKSGSKILISWNSDPYAREYEVQVSTTDTFSTTIDSQRVDGTSWAPNVDFAQPANRKTLFWRVAAMDSHRNLGPFATGSFGVPKAKCVVKRVKKKKKTVKLCVAPHKSKKHKSKHH